MPAIITPLACGACEEDVTGGSISIRDRIYCPRCAEITALSIMGDRGASLHDRERAADVLMVARLRREIAARRITVCLACAREASAQAGFGGIDKAQSGHICGKETN